MKRSGFSIQKIQSALLTFTFFLAMTTPTFSQVATVEDIYRPSVPKQEVKGKILIITDQEYNDTELLYPLYRFTEEGYSVTVASLEGGAIAGYNSAGLKTSERIANVNASDYQALYLPGGRAPKKLREDEKVIALVKSFWDAGKPIGAICHGPQILAKAGLLQGKNVTSWPGIDNEMKEAGATFHNEPVVVDGMLVTSRMPGDLPAQLFIFLPMLK
jgi:protease I